MAKNAFRKALAAGLGSCVLLLGGGAASPAYATPSYENRDAALYLLEENCFFPDAAKHSKKHRNPAPEKLSALFQKMKKDSRTGQALAKGAKELDVAYCEAGGFDKNTGALYQTSLGIIEINWNDTPAYNRRVLAHETMHGVQGGHMLLHPEKSWSFETRLRVSLYEEAAGKAAELMVGFEQKLNGDHEVWSELARHYRDKSFSGPKPPDAFKKAYGHAVRNGKNRQEALNAGGSAAWAATFSNRHWREYYISSETAYLVKLVNKGEFDGAGLDATDINGPARAMTSGRIAPGVSASEHVLPPARSALFEGLPRLEEAFKALELAQAERAFGRDDVRSLSLRSKLTSEKNRYMDADWKKAEAIYDKTKNFRPFNEILDDVNGMKDTSKTKNRKRNPPAA